jgi:hypothetical protein
MSIDLSTYSAVEAAMFCRIDVPDYDVLLFSNYNIPVSINGESYVNLGTLLGITDSTSDLRATSGTLTITISGIPNSSISEVLAQRFKGSKIQVWRVFFDANTKQILGIDGNPAGRFQGIVTNWSLAEDWTPGSPTTSNKIDFTCSSTVDVLSNKVAGRKTNSKDQKKYFPNDLSMDRVSIITKSNFNFGAVVK